MFTSFLRDLGKRRQEQGGSPLGKWLRGQIFFKKMKFELFGKNFDVEILEKEGGALVRVNGKEFFFKEGEEGNDEKEGVTPLKGDFGQEKVLAPISGQITKIFQKEGAEVKKGQVLLILSAMKMENEILVEKTGRVKKIFFKEGDTVKKGDVLAIIK